MIARSFSPLLAALFLALAAAPVAAQTQDQQQAQQQQQGPLTPNETKTVGDWVVRCFPVKSQSPCDMFELLADKKTGKRVMSMSIAYIPSQDRNAMQIALPLGIAISQGVLISADNYKSPRLGYRRCDRLGCYVEGIIDNSAIDSLSRSTSAKVQFAAYGGKTFELNLSLNGFAEARNTMADLAKSRVSMSSHAATPDKPAPSP